MRVTGSHNDPPLLLLHSGGLSGWQWQPQVERLGDYHCLVPDLPGHGESRSVEMLSLDDMTRQVLEAFEHCIGRERFHIVGNSFGGLIALHLLNVVPERIETVMVSGSAAGLGRTLGVISKASAALYRFLPPETLIKLSYAQFGIPGPYRKLFHDDVLRTADAAFARKLTEAMMAFRLPSSVRVPVLAAVGQRETFAAKQAARKIAKYVPCTL